MGISQFNEVQKKVMADLCNAKDAVIVSPPGTGKTVAIILSSIYRLLHSDNMDQTILFVAIDTMHVSIIRSLCKQFTAHIPNMNVLSQFSPQEKFEITGKNICICTAGRTLNFFENVVDESKCNLCSLVIFDADALWVDHSLVDKIKKIFSYIPAQGVSFHFISNSYSIKMEQNMKAVLHDRYQNSIKHFLRQHDCFKYWRVDIDQNTKRMQKFLQILEQNPFKQGIINCKDAKVAKNLKHAMQKKFETRILGTSYSNEVRTSAKGYNNGSVSYIISHKFSPISYLTEHIESDKLRVIINYQIKRSETLLRRCAIRKYKSTSDEIHIISLFDQNEKSLISEIEENVVNDRMQSLPMNFGEILSNKNEDNNPPIVEEEKEPRSARSSSSLNPFVAAFEPAAKTKAKADNERLNRYSGTKRTLIAYIDEYLQNGQMDKILGLNCKDMKIWGIMINDTLRDKNPSEIKMFNNLIVALFNYGIMQKGERFEMSVLKYLVMMTDVSMVKNVYFTQAVGELLAILCHYKHLPASASYSYFCKWYKEYSDISKRGQKEVLHQFVTCSVQELQRLNASQKIIAQVAKVLKK